MTTADSLRAEAGRLADPFPALLAEARRLAASAMPGEHGRRRAGHGNEFWQYRGFHAGDDARQIDWRRSAKSDGHFIRQQEWQLPQTVLIWADATASMRFASDKRIATKAHVARVLALALTLLLEKGGERIGLLGPHVSAGAGRAQIARVAEGLLQESTGEFVALDISAIQAENRAVFLSDFLGDIGAVRTALAKAAGIGAKGVLMQILDPVEEEFPFQGRTIFQSMTGAVEFETQKAGALRQKYLDRLSERKAELARIAREAGWQYHIHHSDRPHSLALTQLYAALDRGRA